jgi:uncharacterized protein
MTEKRKKLKISSHHFGSFRTNCPGKAFIRTILIAMSTPVPQIVPRQLTKQQKPFDASEPEHWLHNTQTITEFIHSLSALFPEGEAFFVRSVRAFCDDPQISSNEKLMKEVKAFVSQEAQHSAEHAAYNKKIGALCHHDMQKIDALVVNIFNIAEKSNIFLGNNKYVCLGITCSLEHLTAVLAEILLTTDEGRYVIDTMSPSHRPLWIWHAIEETEHKAVAYDVYCAAGGWYISRVYRHFLTTAIFVAVVTYLNIVFMIDRANYFDFVGAWKLFKFLLIYPGFLRKFIPMWCEYLQPGYHPWKSEQNRVKMTEAIKTWTTEYGLPLEKKAGNASKQSYTNDKCE